MNVSQEAFIAVCQLVEIKDFYKLKLINKHIPIKNDNKWSFLIEKQYKMFKTK